MHSYAEIDAARRTLCLGEYATLKEVKDAFRRLVKKHHPDKGAVDDAGRINDVINAYGVLIAYIGKYTYSFKSNDVLRQNPDELMKTIYGGDWMWGISGK
ncbi:MAG: J domain-containing protein [Candidatus Altiarchaeota archaeon]